MILQIYLKAQRRVGLKALQRFYDPPRVLKPAGHEKCEQGGWALLPAGLLWSSLLSPCRTWRSAQTLNAWVLLVATEAATHSLVGGSSYGPLVAEFAPRSGCSKVTKYEKASETNLTVYLRRPTYFNSWTGSNGVSPGSSNKTCIQIKYCKI